MESTCLAIVSQESRMEVFFFPVGIFCWPFALEEDPSKILNKGHFSSAPDEPHKSPTIPLACDAGFFFAFPKQGKQHKGKPKIDLKTAAILRLFSTKQQLNPDWIYGRRFCSYRVTARCVLSDLRNYQRVVTCGFSVLAESFHVLHSCKQNCGSYKLRRKTWSALIYPTYELNLFFGSV